VTSRIALAAAVFCFAAAPPASAEVHLTGTATNLKIETRGASLEEVLRLLHSSFKFQYSIGGSLDGAVSGTYSGSLTRVVTRLLEGHNFIIHGTADNLEVIILGAPGTGAPKRVVDAPPAGNAGTEPLKECKAVIDGRTVPVEC